MKFREEIEEDLLMACSKVCGKKVGDIVDIDLSQLRERKEEVLNLVSDRDEVEKFVNVLLDISEIISNPRSSKELVNLLQLYFESKISLSKGMVKLEEPREIQSKIDLSEIANYVPVHGVDGNSNIYLVFRPDKNEREDFYFIDEDTIITKLLSKIMEVSFGDLTITIGDKTYRFKDEESLIHALLSVDNYEPIVNRVKERVKRSLPEQFKDTLRVIEATLTGSDEGMPKVVLESRSDINVEGIPKGELVVKIHSYFYNYPIADVEVLYENSDIGKILLDNSTKNLDNISEAIEVAIGTLRSEDFRKRVNNVLKLKEVAESSGFKFTPNEYVLLPAMLNYMLTDNKGTTRVWVNVLPDLYDVTIRTCRKPRGLSIRRKDVEIILSRIKHDNNIRMNIEAFPDNLGVWARTLVDTPTEVVEAIRTVNNVMDTILKIYREEVREIRRRVGTPSDDQVLMTFFLLSFNRNINPELVIGKNAEYVDRRLDGILSKIDSKLCKETPKDRKYILRWLPISYEVINEFYNKGLVKVDKEGNLLINERNILDILREVGIDLEKRGDRLIYEYNLEETIEKIKARIVEMMFTEKGLDGLVSEGYGTPQFMSLIIKSVVGVKIEPKYLEAKYGDNSVWNQLDDRARVAYLSSPLPVNYLVEMVSKPTAFRERYKDIINKLLRMDRNLGNEVVYNHVPELIGVDKNKMTLVREGRFRGIGYNGFVTQLVRVKNETLTKKTFLVFSEEEKVGFPVTGRSVEEVVNKVKGVWSEFTRELRIIKEIGRTGRIKVYPEGDVYYILIAKVPKLNTKHIVRPNIMSVLEKEVSIQSDSDEEVVNL